MATVRMPSSCAERNTRMAISLRLATRSFLNGGCESTDISGEPHGAGAVGVIRIRCAGAKSATSQAAESVSFLWARTARPDFKPGGFPVSVNVAVVGATGAVGDLMRKVLAERRF